MHEDNNKSLWEQIRQRQIDWSYYRLHWKKWCDPTLPLAGNALEFPIHNKPVERQLGAGGWSTSPVDGWFVFPCGSRYEAEVAWPVAGHQEQWICGCVHGLCSVEERQDEGSRSRLSWLRDDGSFHTLLELFPLWEFVSFFSTTFIWRLQLTVNMYRLYI